MRNHCTRLFLIGVICLGIFLIVPKARAEGIGMVTGSATGTYIQFGRDIAGVVKPRGIDIIVKESEGSLDNVRRLWSKENAAIAIVQSDLLGFLKRSKGPMLKIYSKNLKLMFPFYNEEVHLLARKSIQSFEDLAGKRVVVGTKGSGNYLTSNNLLYMLKIKPSQRIMDLSPAEAVRAVLTSKADAMFFVGGKPVTLFQNISKLLADNNPAYAKLVDNIHFVPLDNEKMHQEYVASTIEPEDYNWVKKKIPTIAVKAVLVCYDFSKKNSLFYQERSGYYQERCQQIAEIGQAIRQSFDKLKQSGHPKWKEVNLDENSGIWEKDSCSQMQSQRDSGETKDEFEQNILDFLKEQH
jgi:TRAP transporter TAXI family solute receptor